MSHVKTMKLIIPAAANIRVVHIDNQATYTGAVDNWDEFDRWARANIAPWHNAADMARSHRLSDADRTRLLAWMMACAYGQMRNEQLQAAENGSFPAIVRLPVNEQPQPTHGTVLPKG